MMPHVWIFSPLPPVAGGVAHYTDVVATELVRRYGYPVHVVVDQTETPSGRPYQIHHWRDLLYRPDPVGDHAIRVYQVANQARHAYVFTFLLNAPGIVVLHDAVIGHLRLKILRERYSIREQMAELMWLSGSTAAALLPYLEKGFPARFLPFSVPFERLVVETAPVLMAHNPDTVAVLRQRYPERMIFFRPMALLDTRVQTPPDPDVLQRWRRILAIPDDAVVFGVFGVLNPWKGLPILLRLAREFWHRRIAVVFLLVGHPDPAYPIHRQVMHWGVHPVVRVLTDVDRDVYRTLIYLCDICFALRTPPLGEFSYSMLELLAAGRVVIVNRHRYNAFWPDGICVRVSLREGLKALLQVADALRVRPDWRRKIGVRARHHVASEYTLDRLLAGYVRLFHQWPVFLRLWRNARMNGPPHIRPLYDRVSAQIAARCRGIVPPVLESVMRTLIRGDRLP